jgi:hypothetical protein
MGSLQLRLLQRLPAGYFVTLWMSSGVATAGAKRQKLFYSASLLFHTTDTNEDEPQYAACEDNPWARIQNEGTELPRRVRRKLLLWRRRIETPRRESVKVCDSSV